MSLNIFTDPPGQVRVIGLGRRLAYLSTNACEYIFLFGMPGSVVKYILIFLSRLLGTQFALNLCF